jgi:hypothetical protein
MKHFCPVALYGKCRLQIYNFLFVNLFIVAPVFAQPSISSFSPSSGPKGTTVTITGTNFSATSAADILYFGAAKATVSAASTTSLTVVAPATATYQPITITVNGLTAYSAMPFMVTFPGGGNIAGSSFAGQTAAFLRRRCS